LRGAAVGSSIEDLSSPFSFSVEGDGNDRSCGSLDGCVVVVSSTMVGVSFVSKSGFWWSYWSQSIVDFKNSK
jgi:hypothetical protein